MSGDVAVRRVELIARSGPGLDPLPSSLASHFHLLTPFPLSILPGRPTMCCSPPTNASEAVEVRPGLWLPRRLHRPAPSDRAGAGCELEGRFVGHDLAGVPAAFVADSLDKLGPQLYKSLAGCQPLQRQEGDPSWWQPSCVGGSSAEDGMSVDGGAQPPRADGLRPDVLLEITFADQDRNDGNPPASLSSQSTLLVPAHSLVWTARTAVNPRRIRPTSTAFATNPQSPPDPFPLSVVPLRLPSVRAWPLIHSWIYLGKPEQLGQHLMSLDAPVEPPSPRPSPRLPAPSPYHDTGSSAPSPDSNPDEDDFLSFPVDAAVAASELFAPPRAAVLDRAALVNALWRTMVALGIEDNELWAHVDGVWRALVDILEVHGKVE